MLEILEQRVTSEQVEVFDNKFFVRKVDNKNFVIIFDNKFIVK
jgi:hypothetical protein